MPITGPGPSSDGKCCNVTVVTRCKGCPYYQSAEYKASVPSVRLEAAKPVAITGLHCDDESPTPSEIGRAASILEAAGYTVTPPDPLAADREFLAGLFSVMGWHDTVAVFLGDERDTEIPAAMEYLRANKGRL